jgi:surfactin synthase thioesterase subunit
MEYKILCFSYAGGSKYSFSAMEKAKPENVKLITYDYPGRGQRLNEKLVKEIDELVEDMYHQIEPELYAPYLIYGHSMGGLVAYKLVILIRSKGHRLPETVFITGCNAPSAWEKKKLLHNLPYNELITELKEMGGIPTTILNDKDSMQFFEPILRADFSVVASALYQEIEPIAVPFKIIIGTEENIMEEDALKWQKETTIPLHFDKLKGGHFFIFDHSEKIMSDLVNCFQNLKLTIQ